MMVFRQVVEFEVSALYQRHHPLKPGCKMSVAEDLDHPSRFTRPETNPLGPKLHGAGGVGHVRKDVMLLHNLSLFKTGYAHGVK